MRTLVGIQCLNPHPVAPRQFNGRVAESRQHPIANRENVGSIPTPPTKLNKHGCPGALTPGPAVTGRPDEGHADYTR